MTLKDFKKQCESKKAGELKLPKTDEEYQPLIQESLEYVAKNTIPTDLISTDPTVETLRWLNSRQLIRMPKATTLPDEKIDIDEQLVFAVLYDLLANRTTDLNKAMFYTQKRDEEITQYQWNNYNLLQQLGAL